MTLSRTDSILSALSFASSSRLSAHSSTEYDTTPGSSTSTVAGPGALAGKAVKALGVATLKGFERLVMARHWAAVTHAFPHTDQQAHGIRHIDEVYWDLLEFSRPGMYSHNVNRRAMALIMAQIGAGETRHLIKALTRWHAVELHILLSGILTQLAHLWNPSLSGVFSSPLSHSYTASQGWIGIESPLLRLIFFISKVVRSSAWACRVVLDVGFLDVLFSLNHHHFYRHHHHHRGAENDEVHHLYIACNALLLDITGYQESRWFVARHPIASTWPTYEDTPNVFPFKIRRRALFLGPDSDVALDEQSPFVGITLPDVCSQPSISEIPPDKLLRLLSFNVTYDQALRVFLSRSSHKQKVMLLSKLFWCMSKLVKPGTGLLDDPLWRYQYSFSLHFITAVARSDPQNKEALIDAGAANYLVDSLRAMPKAYAAATQIIREYGFSGLLKLGSVPDHTIQQSIVSAITALFEDSE
ncbi:hypothetical protein H0H87_010732 [Tephrocybe sp. NHM501043]|nr:hypothetical protein H0H87_010732 [Tephrocybe sp. NHM501043]